MAVDEALEGGAVQEQRRRVGIPGAVLQIALAAVQDMERAAGVEAQAVVGLIETVDDDQVPGLPVAIDQGRQPVRGDVVLERPEAAMHAAQAKDHRSSQHPGHGAGATAPDQRQGEHGAREGGERDAQDPSHEVAEMLQREVLYLTLHILAQRNRLFTRRIN